MKFNNMPLCCLSLILSLVTLGSGCQSVSRHATNRGVETIDGSFDQETSIISVAQESTWLTGDTVSARDAEPVRDTEIQTSVLISDQVDSSDIDRSNSVQLAGHEQSFVSDFATTMEPVFPAMRTNSFEPSSNSPRIEQQIGFARGLERQGNLDESIREFTSLGQKIGEHPVVLHRLAVMYGQKSQSSTAHHFFQRAIAAEPGNAELLCDLGFSCFVNGDIQSAQRYYLDALRIHPGFKRAHNNLGMLLSSTGHNQQALMHFRKAGCSDEQAKYNLATSKGKSQR